jgi:SAM-dependent methyltransferase
VEARTSPEQDRWDEYGARQLAALESDPERFVVTDPPDADMPFVKGLVAALGPVAGKRVVEVGCGRGELSVYLAKQGAVVTGVDIGPNLIAAADRLADINGVQVEFRRVDIKALPFPSASADIVVGLAVLHHLSEGDLEATLSEAHRVLRADGIAVIAEPVENSRSFDFVQNLVPAGKPSDPDYRPSWLRRRAWARYVAGEDQRSLTTKELRRGGDAPWRSVHVSPHGLVSRLERVLPARLRSALWSFDELVLRWLPPVRRFCRTVVVQYVK